MAGKRILITGGSGFIGTNLVSHFSCTGWQVLNIDIAEPRNRQHQGYWTRVDLLDRERVLHVVKDFRPVVVLHFGARTDLEEQEDIEGYAANYQGTQNVLDAIRLTPGVERAIFASSQLVCKVGYRPKGEGDYCPSTLYGESKVQMEKIIRSADLQVPWAIVRPTSIWGPWFDLPYKTFFLTIAKNSYVHPGRTETRKQWGFVGNTVHQVGKLVQAPVECVNKKTFYLADYEPTLLRDFADKVQLAMGAKPIRTVPAAALKTAARVGDGLQLLGWKNPPLTSFRYHNIVTNEIQDLEPLREVAGPLPYTVDQGIELTADWLKNSPNNHHQ